MSNVCIQSQMPAHKKEYPQAIAMYRNGLSVQDVADFFNVTRQAMWAWLKKRNVPMRPKERHGKENHFHRNGRRSEKRALHLVEKAIQKGILHRPSVCEVCDKNCAPANGRPQIEAHHDDYSKPLTVRWLCRKCHFQWHKTHHAAKSGL